MNPQLRALLANVRRASRRTGGSSGGSGGGSGAALPLGATAAVLAIGAAVSLGGAALYNGRFLRCFFFVMLFCDVGWLSVAMTRTVLQIYLHYPMKRRPDKQA